VSEPFGVGAAAPSEPAALSEDAAGSTGHAGVDAAIGSLGEVASLAPREQVAAYVEAHRALHETLSTIEER
jgi:hypothetical protein